MNYKDMKMAIGANIRLRRHQCGLSLNALADKLGVSYQQVQKYEKGQNAPPCDKLILMAKLFQCTIDDLITTDESLGVRTGSVHSWTTQGVSALVSHFCRIPQKRVRNSICSLVKLIADRELLKHASGSNQHRCAEEVEHTLSVGHSAPLLDF